jgi:hypothetical protein
VACAYNGRVPSLDWPWFTLGEVCATLSNIPEGLTVASGTPILGLEVRHIQIRRQFRGAVLFCSPENESCPLFQFHGSKTNSHHPEEREL